MKWAAFLGVMAMVSAILVVVVRHQNRLEFLQVRSAEEIRDELNDEWSRLQLEKATWARHNLVEEAARKELQDGDSWAFRYRSDSARDDAMKAQKGRHSSPLFSTSRQRIVVSVLVLGMVVLAGRAFQLQILDRSRLQAEGAARQLRNGAVKPARGRILDRNGDVLAVSTPLDAVWAHPPTLLGAAQDWPRLAEALGVLPSQIASLLAQYEDREFVYLRRHLPPAEAMRIERLAIPGVASLREYGRYYPAGPIASHVLGFTDVDDRGQEGVEKAFDSHLAGVEGRKRVLRDRKGRAVEDIESLQPVHHGRDLQTSLDLRIQAATQRHLAATLHETRAKGVSAVMLDVRTGEVLAMANAPDFNPNNRPISRSMPSAIDR